MIRRYVNLVLRDYGRRTHSLHRLDVAKHLFYPSTSDAEAANAKENSNNNGGGGDKPKPLPRVLRRRRRLPEPSMRFAPFPPDDDDECDDWPSDDDAFLLLSPGTSEGRILHATEGGRAVLYDADADAISAAMPSFPKPIQDPIAFSVPGSGEFMDEKESLYVMRSRIAPPDHNRQRYIGGIAVPEEEQGPAGDFVVLDFDKPYEWQPLPPPPFAAADAGGIRITSSAVVGGGRTICVSTARNGVGYNYSSHVVERTYCFDTAAREWRHAGDWALPFDGRAEHVPELGAWIGLSSSQPNHLCAADLSAMDINAANQAPTPQHVWDDFTPPPEESSSVVINRRFSYYVLHTYKEWWGPLGKLVNLGSGRFCIVKVFEIRRGESVDRYVEDMLDEEEFAVLTGVEVLRGQGVLRMVKHKSRRYELGRHPWVL
ncbi:unnamed protein product [Urochloa decumbens]|uniref:Uncharacterized protein n=1 Tax=Urochloa decumbens TaxID=240449 RepID=A0ABC9FN97_9POAL